MGQFNCNKIFLHIPQYMCSTEGKAHIIWTHELITLQNYIVVEHLMYIIYQIGQSNKKYTETIMSTGCSFSLAFWEPSTWFYVGSSEKKNHVTGDGHIFWNQESLCIIWSKHFEICKSNFYPSSFSLSIRMNTSTTIKYGICVKFPSPCNT